jgi:hypothetical protein
MDNFIWGALMGVAFAGFVVGNHTDNLWKERLTDRGLALYCPLDGQWAWKGECSDE